VTLHDFNQFIELCRIKTVKSLYDIQYFFETFESRLILNPFNEQQLSHGLAIAIYNRNFHVAHYLIDLKYARISHPNFIKLNIYTIEKPTVFSEYNFINEFCDFIDYCLEINDVFEVAHNLLASINYINENIDLIEFLITRHLLPSYNEDFVKNYKLSKKYKLFITITHKYFEVRRDTSENSLIDVAMMARKLMGSNYFENAKVFIDTCIIITGDAIITSPVFKSHVTGFWSNIVNLLDINVYDIGIKNCVNHRNNQPLLFDFLKYLISTNIISL
jgi:hypothetical protein